LPATTILTALLSRGYFPSELPPTFTTADFGRHASGIIDDWRSTKIFETEAVSQKRAGGKVKLAGSFSYRLQETEAESVSKPKRGYERREVHITHPVPQALLASELANNWQSVAAWLSRGRYSLDRIEVSSNSPRAIGGINFPIHEAKKSFIEATSDWLVRTDISRFYPSIYTHSIPWAAYGKDKVKSDIKRYSGSLADRLDGLVRACNRNQTIGIPVGPETSRILAEIISSKIDQDFAKKSRVDDGRVDRLQDDWFVGTDTLEEAEKVLSAIAATYRTYGLEINGSKTSIDRMVISTSDTWRAELSGFLSHAQGHPRGMRLKEFLALGLRVQADNPTQPVVSYVLSVLESTRIGEDEAEGMEQFLLKGAVLSPFALDKICRVAINVDRDTKKLSKSRVVSRFTQLAEHSFEHARHYETIWLVHTIRGLMVPLVSKKLSEAIEQYAGSALPLILLDMKNAGLFPYKLPTQAWEATFSEERVAADWRWLLAYEGARKGWLMDPKNNLAKSFFEPMHRRNVVFYDPRKNVFSSSKATRLRRATSKRNLDLASRLMFALRGVERPSEQSVGYDY
jgi:hypothetical protein